ncbi:MAG: hypothetical protein V1904_15385 [Bacteroidota bacterium]
MFHYKLISLLFICALYSCNISKHNSESTIQQKPANNAESTLKLIFVNFKITKDSTAEISTVNLTKIKITDGSIKKENLSDIYKPVYQNELRCVFEDNNGENIYETIIEHPLFKKYEYAMDDGSIGVKNIVLQEAVFSIRTDYRNEMNYVHIFEKLSSSDEKEIAKLELKK